VLVQNLGPGAIDRLGFSPETLRRDFPQLVVCSISGYGSSGPYQNRKAFDLLLQGETGVIATTGTEDAPAKVGISVGDIGAAVYGTISVLAGLYQRKETGEGQLVETSLFDALAEWMGYPSYFTLYGGEPPIRAGMRHATVLPYGSYRCGDGQQVSLAVQTEDQWSSFCTVVCERPEWLADERYDSLANRRVHRQELESAIEESLSALSREEVTRRLEHADVPYGDVNTVQQFLEHPQLTERKRWRQIGSPVGPLDAILPPFTFENAESAMGDVPEVGQHSQEVLAELGFSEHEIDVLKQAGAV
jgi:itaconate CoA-transferase